MAPKGYGSISITHTDSAVSNEEASSKSRFVGHAHRTKQWWLVAGVLVLGVLVYALAMNSRSKGADYTKRPYDSEHYPVREHETPQEVEDTSKLALYYHDQLVDHFDKHNTQTWRHRYYMSKKYWNGPGNPIFVIMAGEGSVPEILYQFVIDGLAKKFGGYVLQVEHRFYGKSQPNNGRKGSATNEEMRKYLHPEQAMADYVQLTRWTQDQLGCDPDHTSEHYCPVITIGASYPGFLAAMMRFVYPDVVDMAWASSAPLPLYAQEVKQYQYFEKITDVAEETMPGCAAAVKETLQEMDDLLREPDRDYKEVAQRMNICVESMPEYINTVDVFRDVISMISPMTFADYNMGNYPPSDHTQTYRACQAFLDKSKNVYEKFDLFFQLKGETGNDCYDMMVEVPPGPNGTVASSDWSGVGNGNTGHMWDYQTCKDLVVRAGMSEKSMFIPRPWSLDWLTEHCQTRFGDTPEPYKLMDMWGFDDLVGNGASHILFTNGMKDGWAVASHLEDLSDTLVALNFPNGAHHSDLRNNWPNKDDTDDITEGLAEVTSILGSWLKDLEKDPSKFSGKN